MADQKKNPDQTPLASGSAQRLPLDMDQLGLVAEVKQRIHEAIEDLSSNVSEGDTDAEEAVLKLASGLSSLNALAQSSQKSEAPSPKATPEAVAGIVNAREYLSDAPAVFLRLMAAMQDPQSLDAFDVIAELAGLVDAARTNAHEAVEALGQAEVSS